MVSSGVFSRHPDETVAPRSMNQDCLLAVQHFCGSGWVL